jgi:hypothetical protein
MLTDTKRLQAIGVSTLLVCLFASLLVAVPALSQNGVSIPAADVQVINDNEPQSRIVGFILFLFAQAIVLVAIMISYLKFSHRHTEEHYLVHDHWWNHLHFHH